ncbi:hypothetical protein JYU34_009730 [Plutella xylostella]|uniref:Reverse transcriptase domain-containing protein n=1 Tax=Plutella xylostella TaxID=51655 RepID=A0ABQ7QK77_PLUXY|nr:hypothetical protein JYU34_009730 [Plutella xylostella]
MLNFQGITDEISKTDLKQVMDSTDCNQATNLLINCLQNIIENHTTTITLLRRKTPIKPWITEGLLRCMRTRDKMHKNLRKDPYNEILKTSYRRYRNFCNGVLKKVKRQYEKSELDKASRTNSKQMWHVINNITRFKPTKSVAHDILSISNDPLEAINKANYYFAHSGEELAAKILAKDYNLNMGDSDTPINICPNSLVLLETNLSEVITTIKSLKNTTSSGWDRISTKILQQNIKILAAPITHICNLSITQGIFPKALKMSVITPIHKSGDKTIFSNYRPISLLPTLSKVLEKILYSQLTSYLEKQNILSANQFGFRRGKSTADAVSNLTEQVVDALDVGDRCLAVFLDLRKAFDTISIPKLLKKLENIGIRSLQLELFTDYMSDRYQCVRVGDKISDPIPVNYGVPQGSILGPTLFLIYINDLCNLSIPNGNITSFADDTALMFRGGSWDTTFNHAQTGINRVMRWLDSNLLSLNIEKTKFITFSIIPRTQPNLDKHFLTAHQCGCLDTTLDLCQCENLECTNSIRYLGVILDKHLNFAEHINALSNRVRKLVGIFSNLRHSANPKIMKTVYYALCQSLLTYCINVWGGAAKSHLLQLERAQRAILKVIHFLPRLTPTTEVYEMAEVLTVRQLFILDITIRQHRNPNICNANRDKRRRDIVVQIKRYKTKFSNRFHPFLSGLLYNRLNKINYIYTMPLRDCKTWVKNYIRNLSYSQTEELLMIKE